MKTIPFEDARTFARSLRLNSIKEWKLWCKSNPRPSGMSKSPDKAYRGKGWIDYPDFLGIKDNFVSFEEARTWAHSKNFTSYQEWLDLSNSDQKPDYIPRYPASVYKYQWIGFNDFLNIKEIDPKEELKKYLSYQQAKAILWPMQLDDNKHWHRIKHLHPTIAPITLYKKVGAWKGWQDFLGICITNSINNFNGEFYKLGHRKIYPKTGQLIGKTKKTFAKDQNGYIILSARRKGGRGIQERSLHRLIYRLCYGENSIKKGYQIDHIDSNPTNNSITNLQSLSQFQHNLKTQSHHLLNSDDPNEPFLVYRNGKYVKCFVSWE